MTQRKGDARKADDRAYCAGRVAVGHDRTPMDRTEDGWRCPVCGEEWGDAE